MTFKTLKTADPLRPHVCAIGGRIYPTKLVKDESRPMPGSKWLPLVARPELTARVPDDPYGSMLSVVTIRSEPFQFENRLVQQGATIRLVPDFEWIIELWGHAIARIGSVEGGRTWLGDWRYTPGHAPSPLGDIVHELPFE